MSEKKIVSRAEAHRMVSKQFFNRIGVCGIGSSPDGIIIYLDDPDRSQLPGEIETFCKPLGISPVFRDKREQPYL